jgi:hypothetical protein
MMIHILTLLPPPHRVYDLHLLVTNNIKRIAVPFNSRAEFYIFFKHLCTSIPNDYFPIALHFGIGFCLQDL